MPFRFGHLPHVNYLFSGWMPDPVEALVLFVRERSRERAAWLGVAFLMNASRVIHWFVLTLVPLAATGVVLAFRREPRRDRDRLEARAPRARRRRPRAPPVPPALPARREALRLQARNPEETRDVLGAAEATG